MNVLKITLSDGDVFYTKTEMTPGDVAFTAAHVGWDVNKLETVEMTEAEYGAIPARAGVDHMFGETP
jgi:hypothetical protein